MRPLSSACHRRRAFSLIELLVVVLIIGVLAALLMPAISMVQLSAKKTKFSNNLRQIGAGIFTYAADNDGVTPAFATQYWPTGYAYWWMLVGEQMEDSLNYEKYGYGIFDAEVVRKSIFHDPSDTSIRGAVPPQAASWVSPRPTRNVAYNSQRGARWEPLGGYTNQFMHGYWVVTGDRWQFGAGVGFQSMASIKRPGELCLLGPGPPADVEDDAGRGSGYGGIYFITMMDRMGRYGKTIPFCFADGHVESKEKSWVAVEAAKDYDGCWDANQPGSIFFRNYSTPKWP